MRLPRLARWPVNALMMIKVASVPNPVGAFPRKNAASVFLEEIYIVWLPGRSVVR